MKMRLERFVGNGNSSVEGEDGQRRKTWCVHCHSCNAEQHIRMSRGFLPPDIVLKKFRQSGWMIGTSPEHDLCAKCREPAAQPQPQPQPQEDAGTLGSVFHEQFTRQVEARQHSEKENARLRSENQSLRELTEELRYTQERCHFCGKYPDEVGKLIRGTALPKSVYICEGCVGICTNLISSTNVPSDLLRAVHESLVIGVAENALQKIEAAFPDWPWPKRLPKQQGSIKPPVRKGPNPDFERWLIEHEQEHAAKRVLPQPTNGATKADADDDAASRRAAQIAAAALAEEDHRKVVEAGRRPWTDAEEERLRAGAHNHETAISIARALVRSPGAVRQRLFELGLTKKQVNPSRRAFPFGRSADTGTNKQQGEQNR